MKNIGILLIMVLAIGFAYFVFLADDKQKNSEMMELQDQHNPELADGENNMMIIEDEPKYQVDSKMVNYHESVNGYYASPVDKNGIAPGVVMIHEWWGLNDNIKAMADKLAGQGYQVLAVDLYDGQVAESPERARELVTSIDQSRANANLQAATQYLRNNAAAKVASLGWCFGGGQSLQLAVSGENLDATIIYYGSVIDDASKLENLNWPVLGIFGAEDSSIPVENVNNFQATLDQLGIENDINIYEGVGHAFANPSGNNYSPEETKDAWQKTLNFLQNTLK